MTVIVYNKTDNRPQRWDQITEVCVTEYEGRVKLYRGNDMVALVDIIKIEVF
jgi:hypothetical protein